MLRALRNLFVGLTLLGGVYALRSGGYPLSPQSESATRIVLMHTNDLHGQLQPRNGTGGIAQIATIIRGVKPDLILDAGDLFTGTFLSDEFRGVPTIQAMNQIGYSAGAVGNHEFDYGQEALGMRLREAKFPLLSANLQTPIPEIRPYTVISSKGIRIGVIGLTTEQVKTKSHPDNVVNVTVLDTLKALEQHLPEVRSRSDIIIATVHLEDDEEKRIAGAFPENRLMVGGHTHDKLGPYWLGDTMVVKTGSSGRNVGRVDLDFSGKTLTGMNATLIPVTKVAADPVIAEVLRPYETKVAEKMAQVVGEAAADVRYSKNVESPLANLVADAFRETGKTQIALHNTGGIRAHIAMGRITWGSLFEVLPFQNTLVALKITGAQLKKTLLVGLDPTVGLMAISGLRVTFDRRKSGEDRLVSLMLADGTPVDDAKLYSITTNDFVVAGGDGYTELGNGTDVQDTGIFLRDVFVDYVRARGVLSPTTDGRITISE
jgi:2',3'-cyclic-nucleotide 2'-phosphodiesterase (5'-nucleotidase family)